MGTFSKIREFTCKNPDCLKTWQTEAKGRFIYCSDCKPIMDEKKYQKSQEFRNKICEYRNCKRPYPDTSYAGNQHYCHEEHGRREKQYYMGIITHEDQFRYPDPVSGYFGGYFYTCAVCKKDWKSDIISTERKCKKCYEDSRIKICPCGDTFKDDSLKNKRRTCDGCATAKTVYQALPISDRTIHEREVRGTENHPFGKYNYGFNSWRGRLGELSALAVFSEASDTNETCGFISPYDLEHPVYGFVNVRTSLPRKLSSGNYFWKFDVPYYKPDHLLLIAWTTKLEIQKAWWMPKSQFTSSVFTFPVNDVTGTTTAKWSQFEVSSEKLSQLQSVCKELHDKWKPQEVTAPLETSTREVLDFT